MRVILIGMEYLYEKSKRFFVWINSNRTWVFSGIGITIASIFFSMLMPDVSKDSTIPTTVNESNENNIEINNNVYQDNTINNYSEDTENDQSLESEIAIEIDGDIIYPISIYIIEEQ